MNENLDLTKILEGCPYGTEFYHSGYGRVWFIGINTELEHPIHIRLSSRSYKDAWVTSAGTLNKSYNGECLFFPSKDQRDWSKFERFWDKLKKEKFDVNSLQPFDKLLVRDKNTQRWSIDLYSFYDIDSGCDGYPIVTLATRYRYAIPYNEDTKHLVGTSDCPEYYKWWEE